MTALTIDLDPVFKARLGDGGSFTHRDHLAVAYEMLEETDFLSATTRYADGIKALAAAAGAPTKFNVTITLAFLSLIAERMASQPYAGADDFISRNQDLLSKDLLGAWYTTECLRSDLARTIFLMPDGLNPPGRMDTVQGSDSFAVRPPSTV